MRRTADRLIWDPAARFYREPREHERAQQAQIIRTLFDRKVAAASGFHKAREGMTHISTHIPENEE